MAKKNKKTAFGLIRVSTSSQELQSQKDSLKKIAKEYGFTINDYSEGHDFFSEKISGYDDYDYDRASIVALREQILLRKPDAIFIWELSRLTRNAMKVSKYINELSLDTKIPMYFADYKLWTIDPETGERITDNVMRIQGGAMAVELERERIRLRTCRGRDAKAEQGYYVGHLKDGYVWEYDENEEKVIKVDPDRKDLIKNIFNMYLNQEMTTVEIRDFLNSDPEKYPSPNRYRYLHKTHFKGYKNEYKDRSGNIYTREDSLWTDAMVANIIRDEWYKGIRRYHGVEYSIDPIIDTDTWEECNRRINKFRTRVSTAKQPYILGGLLYCGICGRKMYCHADGGYEDIYFCSSYEYGKKCGLKMVRRQNLDAILVNVVKSRVYNDIVLGEQSPFSDFFNVDKDKVREIEGKIKTYKKLISRKDDEVKKGKGRISFLLAEQSKYFDNPDRAETYNKPISEVEASIEAAKNEILEYEININKLKKQKKLLTSVKEKVIEVSTMDDYARWKELMSHVVHRINLYNPDRFGTIIEILYVNGKSDTAIYYPSRMLKKFIFLSKDEKKIAPYMQYDKDSKKIVFKDLYYVYGNNKEFLFKFNEEDNELIESRDEGSINLGIWNTPQNRERFIKEAVAIGVSECDACTLYDNAVERGDLWSSNEDAVSYYKSQGLSVYKDEISVREYVDLKRNGTLNVFKYEDLLPMSDRGLELKEYHRRYLKRYNTGTTFEPFIVKDADYDKICKERKHLYNRRYKIIHNKSLSVAQKEEQLLAIEQKLEAFKYQLKYLPSNKKGQNHIEKYNQGQKKE